MVGKAAGDHDTGFAAAKRVRDPLDEGPQDSPKACSLSQRRAWAIVFVLGLLYVFSFADRFVLALLVAPIREQFGVSDFAVSVLYGPAFAIFYAVLGFPAGRLSDYANRRLLIVGGVTIWGACTVTSGLVSTYWMLVALRAGLAVGEAALTPAAYSLIGDMFPPEQRRRAASVYMAMGSLGSSGSFILGALVLSFTGAGIEESVFGIRAWQTPFIALGVPTLVIGLIFFLISREPARFSQDARPNVREAVRYICKHSRLYLAIFAGGAFAGTITLTTKAWSAEILRRGFELTIPQAGYGIGTASLVGSFLGSLLLPALSEGLERLGRRDATLIVSMVGAAGAAVCTVGLLFTADPVIYIVLVSTICLLGFGAGANIIVALQRIAPSRLRGVLVALALAIQMLVGLGLGPPVVALVSQAMSAAGDKLAEALALTAVAEAVIAGGLFLLGRRAWEAAFCESAPRKMEIQK